MLNTINVAASGLAVSREQVENVMNNIANENTPGYKKRVVGVSEASHVDARLTGRGAMVGDTTRVTNIYLYDNLTEEKGKQSAFSENQTLLSDIEAIFYETDDSGFSADLDRYFQSVENLRSDPTNEIYKNDLRNTGKVIVKDMQNLYKDIENREKIATNTVDDNIEELNTILNDIGTVNKALSESAIISNDLLDKRDQLEQELTKYIDINMDRTENYELKISGMTAVRFDNNIHKVMVSDKSVAQKDVYATDQEISTLVNQATWVNDGDKVTYKLNNTISVDVSYGETVNGVIVDKTNVIKSLAYKINHTPDIASRVTAYNGQYVLDKEGNKILTNDPKHPDYDSVNPNKERYLIIESDIKGDLGKFSGRIIVEDADAPDNAIEVSTNKTFNVKGEDDVHLEIFDKELILSSGKLKPMIDNLKSNSGNNRFLEYKEKLDNFAKALSDMTQSYIQNDDESYVYGESASDVHDDRANKVTIGLFSGGTVESLKFNSGVVGGLDQKKLDYLATLQWKDDIAIDGTDGKKTSFIKYNQALRVQISDDVENAKLKKVTQDAVTKALTNNYDKLIKVDKDEEMMNLIKFQAAYEANAKLITMIDEMLATILGMRR